VLLRSCVQRTTRVQQRAAAYSVQLELELKYILLMA
jgi:hypothetical protein